MTYKNTISSEYAVICVWAVATVCSSRIACDVLSRANDVIFVLPLIIVNALGFVSYVLRCEAKYKWLAMVASLLVGAIVSALAFGLPAVFQ